MALWPRPFTFSSLILLILIQHWHICTNLFALPHDRHASRVRQRAHAIRQHCGRERGWGGVSGHLSMAQTVTHRQSSRTKEVEGAHVQNKPSFILLYVQMSERS